MSDQPTITAEAIDAYSAAEAHVWRVECPKTQGDAVRVNRQAIRAGLAAAAHHIAAQTLRAYADQQHPHAIGHAQRVEYGTGIEHDTTCAGCGSSWSDDDGGCTERVELLRAANALVTPPACNCHETGAPCNCADGLAGRPGSSPAMRTEPARSTCGTCDGSITWDPDEPTRQQPRWRHDDQAASYRGGAHRAKPACPHCDGTQACTTCGSGV